MVGRLHHGNSVLLRLQVGGQSSTWPSCPGVRCGCWAARDDLAVGQLLGLLRGHDDVLVVGAAPARSNQVPLWMAARMALSRRGFIVWPPLTTASTPRSPNTAFRPSPAATATKSRTFALGVNGGGGVKTHARLVSSTSACFSRHAWPASGGRGTASCMFSILKIGRIAVLAGASSQHHAGVRGIEHGSWPIIVLDHDNRSPLGSRTLAQTGNAGTLVAVLRLGNLGAVMPLLISTFIRSSAKTPAGGLAGDLGLSGDLGTGDDLAAVEYCFMPSKISMMP